MRQERQENLFSGLSTINRISKAMISCFAVWLLFIAAGCSATNSAKMMSFQIENAAVHKQNSNIPNKNVPTNNENSKTLDCTNPNGYSLVVVEDPSRNIEETVTTPKLLNIVVGDEVMTTVKIPTVSDANGFSLTWAKKTKEGFEISVEYGSRYHYQKQFNFICKEGNFYLYAVKVESFDKNDPESMDKPDEKEVQINPNLPIEKFSLFDYLTVK